MGAQRAHPGFGARLAPAVPGLQLLPPSFCSTGKPGARSSREFALGPCNCPSCLTSAALSPNKVIWKSAAGSPAGGSRLARSRPRRRSSVPGAPSPQLRAAHLWLEQGLGQRGPRSSRAPPAPRSRRRALSRGGERGCVPRGRRARGRGMPTPDPKPLAAGLLLLGFRVSAHGVSAVQRTEARVTKNQKAAGEPGHSGSLCSGARTAQMGTGLDPALPGGGR